MKDISKILSDLESQDPVTKKQATDQFQELSVTERNDLITVVKRRGQLSKLHTLLTGIEKPIIDTSKIKLPKILQKKHRTNTKEPKTVRQPNYGIYTVGDHNFFPGIVAAINSLRYHQCYCDIGVIDIGFEGWMIDYLNGYKGVRVLNLEPIKKNLRYTDVRSDQNPAMNGWAYKAFGIVHYDLFEEWTFIDGDFLPLCNLESELRPLLQQGRFVSTEDGSNTWTQVHEQLIGVKPGTYININAGFISLSMERHGWIIHEWRNLMTRKRPFDTWYGDQGALNAVLDKYDIDKDITLDRRLWNQTQMNSQMAQEGQVTMKGHLPYHAELDRQIMSWHGTGWYKLWHQIGIDHYRKDKKSRSAFYRQSQNKSPKPIVTLFKKFLFLDAFNKPLRQVGHLLRTS